MVTYTRAFTGAPGAHTTIRGTNTGTLQKPEKSVPPHGSRKADLFSTHQRMSAVPKSSRTRAEPELRVAWSSALHEARSGWPTGLGVVVLLFLPHRRCSALGGRRYRSGDVTHALGQHVMTELNEQGALLQHGWTAGCHP